MAEVTTLHDGQAQEQEQADPIPSRPVDDDDLYAFDFNPLSPPNVSFFVPSYTCSHNFSSYSDSDYDSESESDSLSDMNCIDDEHGQMNFVTDLFASREEVFVVDDHDSVGDPFIGAATNDVHLGGSEGSRGFVSSHGEDIRIGLGFGSHIDSVELPSELGESTVSRGSNSSTDGLRVVGIDSDSDSEEVIQDVNSGIRDNETGPLGDSDFPPFWDSFGFEQQGADNRELEWEEVDERIDEREGLSSVIDLIEELSVSSEVSINEETSDIGEDVLRNLEWEVLLAVNNLERAIEFENDGNDNGATYLAFRDEYIYEAEYDTLFGQFVQNENALKGSPPAAKSVVENLPMVVLTEEELRENNLVCAVCKDEILVKEKVTSLPCYHHYHEDCIVPWLNIRNTCPVCRYELPTDDPDYEQRKTRSDGDGRSPDLQVRYNFELLP